MSDHPFTVSGDEETTRISFGEDVTERRTEADEEALDAALERCATLAIDVSATRTLRSQWWRYIGRLGQRARRIGNRVVVVGASETLRATADAVAASDHVEFVASIGGTSA
jgi:hypothetical protein